MPPEPAKKKRGPIPRLRWWIGGLLFASTVINYIDRQTLSALAPFLKRDYGWTNEDYALIVIAFRVAYAIGQTALGRMIDRFGTRLGLTVTVAWYSVVAMLDVACRWASQFCALFDSFSAWANLPTGPPQPKPCRNGSPNANGEWRWRCSTADLRLEPPSLRRW